jgi:hypothetical protein
MENSIFFNGDFILTPLYAPRPKAKPFNPGPDTPNIGDEFRQYKLGPQKPYVVPFIGQYNAGGKGWDKIKTGFQNTVSKVEDWKNNAGDDIKTGFQNTVGITKKKDEKFAADAAADALKRQQEEDRKKQEEEDKKNQEQFQSAFERILSGNSTDDDKKMANKILFAGIGFTVLVTGFVIWRRLKKAG